MEAFLAWVVANVDAPWLARVGTAHHRAPAKPLRPPSHRCGTCLVCGCGVSTTARRGPLPTRCNEHLLAHDAERKRRWNAARRVA
jgi:hypothetical protein